MELQRRDTLVVAAAVAFAARLVDKDLLRTAAPPCHRLGRAANTARVAVGPCRVDALPVDGTNRQDALGAGGERTLASRSCRCLQLVALQPVTNACRTSTELGRDLANREIRGNEPLKLLARDRATWRVLRSVDRAQAVLLHPVRHRRRVLAQPPGDLLD